VPEPPYKTGTGFACFIRNGTPAHSKLVVPLGHREERLRTREAALQKRLRHNTRCSCTESTGLSHDAPKPKTDEMDGPKGL